MPQPSNSKLLEAIQQNHEENVVFQAEIKTRLKSVEEQVKKTNGRVNTLEADKIARDAVNEDRERRPQIKAETAVIKNYWNDPKLVATVTALITAATAFLIGGKL